MFAFVIEDLLKEKGFALGFQHTAKLKACQRMELGVFVDRLTDPHQFTPSFKGSDIFTQIFVISHLISPFHRSSFKTPSSVRWLRCPANVGGISHLFV
jgi:hypothetical protein